MSRLVKPRVGYTDLLHRRGRAPLRNLRRRGVRGPVAAALHQIVVGRLLQLLDDYAKARGGIAITAPLDIVFTEFNVLQPDIVFFAAERQHFVRLREPIRDVPDLVAEVLSPSTEATDRGRKLQAFARFGVPEYWIVDSDAPAIEILKLAGRDYVLDSKVTADEAVKSARLPELTFGLNAIIPRG